MKYTAAPGVFDIIPEPSVDAWRQTHVWQFIEQHIRDIASQYGFLEMRTPIFERVELFQREVGDSSDIVSKEMYVFEDRGHRHMALRPEGTAPAMRAFLENGLPQQGQMHKLYYIEPMFRYDRPQAGRYRQHHQFGVEAIGSASAYQDVEVIDLLYQFLTRVGLKELQIQINSIGDSACRAAYKEALIAYLKPYTASLSQESQKRLLVNPLRILDSKDAQDRKILEGAPSILDFLSSEAKEHFEEVQKLLSILEVPYVINPKLVRGLDYYNRTVFEVVVEGIGAQNSLGGGGRYDGLIASMGGPSLSAFGFGCGMERVIQALIAQQALHIENKGPLVHFIPLGDSEKEEAFKWIAQLRKYGIAASMEMMGRKIGKAMHYADTIRAQYVVVLGPDEVASQHVNLKDMATGEAFEVPLESLVRVLNIDQKSALYASLFQEFSQHFATKPEADFFLKRIRTSIAHTKTLISQFQDQLESLGTTE